MHNICASGLICTTLSAEHVNPAKSVPHCHRAIVVIDAKTNEISHYSRTS
jgi:hypothetical protein